MSRPTDQVGRVLSGRYRLIAPVGSGASAQVFLADDVRLKRRVAVKVLHDALADDDSFLRRFRAEAQAAAALNHPNILTVFDWGEDEGSPYLVTEYLGGGSVRSLLDRGVRCTPSQALLLGLEAARGLDYAHRRGLVHRDIKPANLLFGDDGRLRIADFGLARALAEAAWTEPQGAVLGTARYASPEQARGETVDGRGDVYSLGLALIEAVTGQVPFAADTTIGTLMARVGRPVEVPESLGPLRKVLERVGQPEPAARPDAGELGVGLMAIAGDLPRPQPLPLLAATPTDAPVAPQDDTELGRRSVFAEEPTRFADGEATVVEGLPVTVGVEPLDVDEIEGWKPPRRRRRWPWVTLLVLLLAGGGGAGAWYVIDANAPTYPMINVVGLDVQAANAAILAADHGWGVREEQVRQDGTKPGQVLRSDPPLTEELKRNGRITLFVSQGNTLATIPDGVVGQGLSAATQALQAAGGFTVAKVEEASEEVPKDTVLRFGDEVPANRQLPKESAVQLVVSSGPAPRQVPSDLGATFASAKAAIEAVQLEAVEEQRFSDEPVGTVIGSEPGAGASVPRDGTVKVLVSKGPDLVKVPNVQGKTQEQAKQALQAAGLAPGQVFGPIGGTPFTTDPPAGQSVKRGTTVNIYLK